eukprot:SAG31_NODE_5904_length_2264_cov_1.732564_1_plen_413_part_10
MSPVRTKISTTCKFNLNLVQVRRRGTRLRRDALIQGLRVRVLLANRTPGPFRIVDTTAPGLCLEHGVLGLERVKRETNPGGQPNFPTMRDAFVRQTLVALCTLRGAMAQAWCGYNPVIGDGFYTRVIPPTTASECEHEHPEIINTPTNPFNVACTPQFSLIGTAMHMTEDECVDLFCGAQISDDCKDAIRTMADDINQCLYDKGYLDALWSAMFLYIRLGQILDRCDGGSPAPPPSPSPEPGPSALEPTPQPLTPEQTPGFCGHAQASGSFTAVSPHTPPSCRDSDAVASSFQDVNTECDEDPTSVLAGASEQRCYETLCGYTPQCKSALQQWAAALQGCVEDGVYFHIAVQVERFRRIVERGGVCTFCRYGLEIAGAVQPCGDDIRVGGQCHYACEHGMQPSGVHTCGSDLH